MNLSPSNQRNQNTNLFGLLGNRFLYKTPGKSPENYKIPHDKVTAAKLEAKEKRKTYSALLKTRVNNYNKTYGEDAASTPDGAHVETLKLDLKNLPATKKQIERIIAALGKKARDNSKPEARAGWKVALYNDPQYKLLKEMRDNYIPLIEQLTKKLEGKVEQAQRGRLMKRHKRMIEASERKAGWQKRENYKRMSKTFDTLAASKEYRDVFESPEGIVTQNQREAKQLFFAIMAEKTNNFKDDFVLGDAFTNDPKKNIERFPFIYNKFLEHEGIKFMGDHVSLELIASAQSDADEADKKLVGMRSANEIIKNNSAGAIPPIPTKPSVPNTVAWEKRKVAIEQNIMNLEQSAADETDSIQREGWLLGARQLKVYLAQAKAYIYLSALKDRERKVQSKFTRSELSRKPRRALVMELAMEKFLKAMKMVDNPYGTSKWKMMHPSVRRMLIASIYDTGVASYKKGADGTTRYEENIKPEHVWMQSALALSDYFNFKKVGEHMSGNHKAVLKAAYLSSRIAVVVDNIKPVKEVLDAWIEVREKEAAGAPKAEIDAAHAKMEKYPPALVNRFKGGGYKNIDVLKKTRDEVVANRKRLKKFLKDTRAAIQDPIGSKKFIEAMKKGDYKTKLADDISYLGNLGVVDALSLEAYEKQMYGLEINFMAAEFQSKNDLMFFKGFGMNIEGLEPAYLAAIKGNPNLKFEYWDRLFLGSEAEFKSLIGLLNTIIPGNDAGGKADFIAGLKSLRKKYKGLGTMDQVTASLEEGSEDAAILDIFRMLQEHLENRADIAAFGARKEKEIQARLNGLHIGDKISKYVGGVWDMLAGPGQSPANRAAGLVLMYMGYKAVRKAMKGEGKSGKALRALFVATASEIAIKNITGRGILDRLGMDAISGAMEGTYEAVLVQDAEKNMEDKDITTEAHAAALYELNDAPFHEVMKWYESSDNNGMPRVKGGEDHFLKLGINLNKIGPKVTWEAKDKKLEARRVVWETVRHFFTYVGAKANKRGHNHGKEALKERWITMIDHPTHKPRISSYNHREWLRAGNVQKSDVSWQLVMRAEIDPSEVDLTYNKTAVGKIIAEGEDIYEGLSKWTRKYVSNPASGHAEEFFKSMGEGAQDAKVFFEDVSKSLDRKIYFGKKKAVLWYGAHQYEIKRVAADHWNLLVTGVGLPFKVVYAVDRWAVPWTLAKLNEIEGILDPNQAQTTKKDLALSDLRASEAHVGSTNITTNPHFRYLGVYQEPFLNAMATAQRDPQGNVSRTIKPKGQWYHEDLGTNVGYFISEVRDDQAGIKPNDQLYDGNPNSIDHKMMAASHKKAVAMFKKKTGMKDKVIKKYMYPIHKVVKTVKPRKVYIFWRLPLKGSAELDLKARGKWADYMDPRSHKGREAFKIDPSQTSWENLRRAFLLDMDVTRTVAGKVGSYAAQIPRFVFWNIEAAGGILKTIASKTPAGGADFDAAVDAVAKRPEGTRQLVDEFFTSAGDQHKSLSKFYKDPANAKLYTFALEFAKQKGAPLFLGIMEGRTGLDGAAYEGRYYLKHSNPQKAYREMLKYYQQHYVDSGKPDPEIDSAIRAKMTNPPTP